MWLSNNKQFLFSDPEKHEYVLRILGKDEFQYFKDLGMDEMELSKEAEMEIQEIIQTSEGDIDDALLERMIEAGKVPKNPIVTNPNVKDPTKYKIKPKLSISKKGDYAELSMVPEDLDGVYDYVPDVKSMSVGADIEYTKGMENMLTTLMNPSIAQMLAQEGVKVNIQDLLVTMFNNLGSKDAEKYFSTVNQPTIPTQGVAGGGQITPGAGVPNTLIQGNPASMGQPTGVPGQQVVPEGIQPQMGQSPSL